MCAWHMHLHTSVCDVCAFDKERERKRILVLVKVRKQIYKVALRIEDITNETCSQVHMLHSENWFQILLRVKLAVAVSFATF